jgi:poly-beta-1,6-N-acetyl-D-glucosamine synthase
LILLILFSLFLGILLVLYSSYYLLVLRTKNKDDYIKKIKAIVDEPLKLKDLPNVTILIPAYNEEETLHNKMKNIAEFDYPPEKIEVLVLDDCSTDGTRAISESGFKEFRLNGKVLSNSVRSGVNVSYNSVMPRVNSDYILTTDADARIPSDTLLKAMKIMTSLKGIGAVAAKMVPLYEKQTFATRATESYATSYDSMLIAESSMFSTFPGSTCCLLMWKKAFSPISTSYGSSDGNISLGIIKNGYKYLLAPSITYLEPVSENVREQRRQKIRRATRLIQSSLLNINSFRDKKYESFGKVIFPLRLLMMTLGPILTFASIILFFVILFFASPYLFIVFAGLAAFLWYLGAKTNIRKMNFITSFLLHQMYLFLGFLSSYKKVKLWRKIERKSSI